VIGESFFVDHRSKGLRHCLADLGLPPKHRPSVASNAAVLLEQRQELR
jgi:hypothetical protein